LKEWKIIEGQDYRESFNNVSQVIREEIERHVIPTLEDYPYPVKGKNERTIKKLRDNWEGFYEFKVGGVVRPTHRLIFQPNLNSKKVRLVWVKSKPLAY
jgi:hypothetical protein